MTGGYVATPRRALPRRLVLVAAIGSALTSCQESDDMSQLAILRDDPMADEALLGLRLLSAEEHGYRTALGKPRYTEVTRSFAAGSDPDATLAAAVEEAKASGWAEAAPLNQDLVVWQGSKEEPRRTCSISLDRPAKALRLTLTVVEAP